MKIRQKQILFSIYLIIFLKKLIKCLFVGSNISNLSSKIQTLKIPLPPLEIQEQNH
ncbi:restriction endonuclease subunit S [Helicobacter cetorum]|uniref:restriction endonuclease subunit S n=1 Tax=Helicobacter cetorum TaxID=138563 RepID=UPI00131598C8